MIEILVFFKSKKKQLWRKHYKITVDPSVHGFVDQSVQLWINNSKTIININLHPGDKYKLL